MRPRLFSQWLPVVIGLCLAVTTMAQTPRPAVRPPRPAAPAAPAAPTAAESPLGPRAAQWREVQEAMNQGLPQTALEKLKPLQEAALREQNWPELIKAVGRRIVLETQIEGRQPSHAVLRWREELAQAPAPAKPFFHTLVAHAYWSYFNQNRWRIQQRTSTAESPGPDFQTWDLRQLFAEIDREFNLALAEPAPLRAAPVESFDLLLPAGTIPDRFRPTLYDFLAHETLEFYATGEQAGARPEDAFGVDAESPAFGDLATFLAWKPATTDTNAVAFKAIGLWQELLRFHQNDPEPSALLDTDLGRLRYAKNTATGPTKDARFIAALEAFALRHQNHELSALARHEWARVLQGQQKLQAAHVVATEAVRQHPNTPGGKLCANLIREIEAPIWSAETERIWNAPWPRLEIQHRNVPRLWFRVVATDWNQYLARNRSRPERLNQNERLALLRETPTLEWNAELPATPDFTERSTELAVPEGLRPGFYFLLASRRADFAEDENEVTLTSFWRSDLALVVRTRVGNLEGFVLNAQSGEPLANAQVEAWSLSRQGERIAVPPQSTDANGFFTFPGGREPRRYLLKARHGGQEVALEDDLYGGVRPDQTPARQTTIFFTDRGLYRPGQLIQYKGLCANLDPTGHSYTTVPKVDVTVLFRDANGNEIARAQHRANDFGSFSGTFTAPRDRVTGFMSISTEQGPPGQTQVTVEEYKRPKFHVVLNAPKEPGKLNERVTVAGNALAYTGAAIDHAKVTWRVVRQVRFPMWCLAFRFGPSDAGGTQEIAHGVTETDAEGGFTLSFTALPDPAVSAADEPTFHYEVHADVTDSTGETRSEDRGVNVGYAALKADFALDEWQTVQRPVEIRLTTESLDDEPQAAQGTLKIHRLEQPAAVQRSPLHSGWRYRGLAPGAEPRPDPADPNQWKLGALVTQANFTTPASGRTTNSFRVAAGAYRVLLETQDRFGKAVTAKQTLIVLDPDAPKLGVHVPTLLEAASWSVEPGNDLVALWGTGYEQGRAFIEIEHQHRLLTRFWTPPGRTQNQIRQSVTEAMRGGFTVHVTQVRENRSYSTTRHVDVPWSNRKLDLAWETFRSKLEPGKKESWALIIRPPGATTNAAAGTSSPSNALPAEVVATLYDASLDQFRPFDWPREFGFFDQDDISGYSLFANAAHALDFVRGRRANTAQSVVLTYRDFPPDLVARWGRGYATRTGILRKNARMAGEPFMLSEAVMPSPAAAPAPEALSVMAMSADGGAIAKGAIAGRFESAGGGGGGGGPGATPQLPQPNLSQVSPRKNLKETAFFLPHLTSDSNGVVRLTFEMPEALTEWKFLGFAHDRELRSGFLTGKAVTARDLMVQPNPPRFLREGDIVEFTAKVSNTSATPQRGRLQLHLAFAQDNAPADTALGNAKPELDFEVPAKESRSYAWRLSVPDGCGFLTFKVIASTGTLSDGEEGFLPVLSRRVLLTESLPLPIRGPATNRFTFANLRDAAKSSTLQHERVTVQMVSNPAWYAVLALPYLMEYPHECSEQTFNRLYANALARHIATRDPKIRAVFDQWRGTPALDSPLEKNADLKAVALEETPWWRDAKNESEARRNVGVLFEENRLQSELQRGLQKLSELQLADGGWSWFPGGPRDDYITLYIVTGFGRLRHLGAEIPMDPAVRALAGLDQWMFQRWDRLRADGHLGQVNLDPTVALYLYGRSFFLRENPVAPPHQPAFAYWIDQAREHWLKLNHRQPQGHVALALSRLGEQLPAAAKDTPAAILRSLKERSVTNPELGRFWREDELSWSWFRAPIETQALMIEAFDEVAHDDDAVEDLKVWLLKQKQTQDWKTTKATADAVYGLLRRGTDLLSSTRLVEVELGGRNLTPRAAAPDAGRPSAAPAVEPGTGFYEHRFNGPEITAQLGDIVVKKTDPGIAWGSVHWQYFEELGKVKPYAGTPLTLTKSVFTRVNTKSGPKLDPLRGPTKVGDELVVRVELRVDRDMEYVHLKDQRGSGTEPVNVLSGYRFQDGLGYYESTRDTASHFFISYLPKGTYVFEYAVRVQHRGEYPTGVASIQCMYAPEFNSHSGSIALRVE